MNRSEIFLNKILLDSVTGDGSIQEDSFDWNWQSVKVNEHDEWKS